MRDKLLCELTPRSLLRFLCERKIDIRTKRGLAIIAAWLWDKAPVEAKDRLADFYCDRAGFTVTRRSVERLMETPSGSSITLDAREICPKWLLNLLRQYPVITSKLRSIS